MKVRTGDPSTILLLGSTAVVSIFVYTFFKTTTKRLSSKKGDNIPIAPAGWIDTIIALAGNRAPWFLLEQFRLLHSPSIFQIRVPFFKPAFVVACPTLQRQVLLDKSADKPQEIYARMAARSRDQLMFTRPTSHHIWKAVRKGSAPAFSKIEVGRMNRICSQAVEDWMQSKLQMYLKNNASFDPVEEMTMVTFKAILESAFEYQATEEEFKTYNENLRLVLEEIVLRSTMQPWRRPLWFLFPKFWQAMRSNDCCYELVTHILKTYQRNPNKSPQNTVIKLVANNPALTGTRKIVTELGGFLVGGFETTGHQLASVLVLVAEHPRVGEKIRESLRSSDGGMSEYLECVLMEARRMMPPAAMGTFRELGRPLQDKNGAVLVPAKSILFMPQVVPHYDELIFPDPHEFRPERWEQPTDAMKQAIMTFAVGSRNCLGQSLAMAELNSVLPKLLARVKVSVAQTGHTDYALTLKFRNYRLHAELLKE